MPKDKTVSHIKIMQAARDEFMEAGFEKASMRNIGARCGLTAAAIYRHCTGKEDLFAQLAAPAAERIDRWIEAHVARYMDAVQEQDHIRWHDSEIDMMREVVYPHMEEYYLLLTKSQGTKYANFLHELTERHQEHLMRYIPLLRQQGLAVSDIAPEELHILLTAYTAALFEPVVHNYSRAEALHCLDKVEAFFLPGWKQLMGF